MQLVCTNIPIIPTKLNSLECYPRVTTFLEIVLVFPWYYKCGIQAHINHFHSSLVVSSSLSSSSSSESIDSSNQKVKKNNKKMKKKKHNNKGGNQASIAINETSMEESSNHPHKFKFPCKLCKGDHLLSYCPGIPKIFIV